ncbi:MAG: hypothetical protein Q8R09_02685, partial [Anaerolineaceae bacterium]|nr:hypothetical protein [Anaerolineaceae bacterium]
MTFLEKINSLLNRYFILFMLIALVSAAFLRFVNLGASNLTDHEATIALQALNSSKGQSGMIGGQPGYVGLTSLLFSLFEANNFFARFWPVLFGIALVMVPGLFRKQLGEFTCIILAFLIAFEPGLVALSRSADGTMITITSLLLAIGFLLNRKLIPAGIAFGLACIGSENFWPLAFAIGLAWLLVYLVESDKTKAIGISSLKMDKSGWLVFG